MMKIEHVALWSSDIERMRAFYQMYFDAQSNTKYTNEDKQFQSYFLTFSSGTRLEIMQRLGIHSVGREQAEQEFFGYAHIAFSVGSERAVDELTTRLAANGYAHLDGPRYTVTVTTKV